MRSPMLRNLPTAGLVLLLVFIAWSDLANYFKLSTIERAVLGSVIDEPIQLENHIMEPTCTTQSKTVGDTTYSQTYYQGPRESGDDYRDRIKLEWRLYCESNGI